MKLLQRTISGAIVLGFVVSAIWPTSWINLSSFWPNNIALVQIQYYYFCGWQAFDAVRGQIEFNNYVVPFVALCFIAFLLVFTGVVLVWQKFKPLPKDLKS